MTKEGRCAMAQDRDDAAASTRQAVRNNKKRGGLEPGSCEPTAGCRHSPDRQGSGERQCAITLTVAGRSGIDYKNYPQEELRSL
jgi:hypothetical protein